MPLLPIQDHYARDENLSSAWKSLSQNIKLVSLPDIYLRLRTVLDDPTSDLADVTQVLENDPALVSRLLSIVNSAYFGLGSEVDSISRAIGFLGTGEVHDLVLTVSVTDCFDGISNNIIDMHRFWRRSVVCAIATRELAHLNNLRESERLFAIGLLRDIGHLLIYQVAPQQAEQAIALSKAQDMPLHKAEHAVLGVHYAKVGADQMRRWQLPQSVWEPTEYQLEPAKSQDFEMFTSLIHIAVHLTEGIDQGLAVEEAAAGVSEHAWHVTGIAPDQCADIVDKVEVQVAAVMRLIFPSLTTNAA